jgi:hypothetical protein
MDNVFNSLYKFDNADEISIKKKKSLILNNVSRTKGVDKFCQKIINIINNRHTKKDPDIMLGYIETYCKNRLELNKEIRVKSHIILKKLKENNYINDEGVEWIK